MVSDSKYGSYWIIEDSKDIFKNENRKNYELKHMIIFLMETRILMFLMK